MITPRGGRGADNRVLVDINRRLQVVAMTLHSPQDDTTKTDSFSPLWLHWKAEREELLGVKSEEWRPFK